ncbi:MAG TPA: phosphoribosylaminoimidazolesuccinocarboxamide synthase [Candidatus Acidoferrales bacterium]|nr:phosphoribosylaminoimidazolesuccinocarboxamide synthase [Candidatus Acidoferrales bacterium]
MEPGPALLTSQIDLPLFAKGKVRDTYVLSDDRLLMVTTDRISAYDHVLPTGIPDRGKVLTQLSIFWFSQTLGFQENHLVSGMIPDLPDSLRAQRDQLSGRFMIVKRAQRIDVECVVRGYLAGSAWSEYQQTGGVAGESLGAGLEQSQKLDHPIFTPASKEDSGHDQNITFAQMRTLLGDDLAERLKSASLGLYEHAEKQSAARGLILADTKFEFGLVEGRLVLIDEVLTPDSSRYWDAELYRVGISPPSYDKQFVRDWLDGSGWDRESEPPRLPDDIVAQTRERYLVAYQKLVGTPLFPAKERV